jgi:hypothetical protein
LFAADLYPSMIPLSGAGRQGASIPIREASYGIDDFSMREPSKEA